MKRAEHKIVATEEAVTQYRTALLKYKRACSSFAKIQVSWKSIKDPTQAQRIVYLMAKDTFSVECKAYAQERAAWNASFLRSQFVREIESPLELEKLLMLLPSGKTKDVDEQAQRIQKIKDIENDPQLSVILRTIRGEIQAPSIDEPTESEPEEVDAFKDLEE
jgi:hypothetical protein